MGSGSSIQPPAVHKAVEVPNLKIAVVGDPQVGKTSILTRYIHNQFSPIYVQTHKASIDNVVRKLNVPGHAKVPITLWDIPGHEDLPLYSSYFTDLDAVIVVVDLYDPASLETATLWRQTVLTTASFTTTMAPDGLYDKKDKRDVAEDLSEEERSQNSKNIEDIPFLLLGNKLDLCTSQTLDGGDVELERIEKGDSEKEKEEGSLNLSNRVQKLEEIAGCGFVGSVAVSAHNNDLSVHAAIQTFLRRILDKKSLVQRRCPARLVRQSQHNGHTGRPRYHQERQLKPVGIEEIDAKFGEAEEILYRVNSLQRYQEDSLRKFASQCVEVGVIATNEDASMQNCLIALKDQLLKLDLQLKLKVDEDFCHLEVKASTEDAGLDKDTRYALKTFNKEYAAVTRAMIAEFPIAQAKLNQIDAEVDHMCKSLKEQGQGSSGHRIAGLPAPSTAVAATTSAAPLSEKNEKDHSGVIPTPGAVDMKTQRGTILVVPSQATIMADNRDQASNTAAGVRMGAMVEKNRAVLRHTAHECHDCLAHIQRSVKQAKAAFVW